MPATKSNTAVKPATTTRRRTAEPKQLAKVTMTHSKETQGAHQYHEVKREDGSYDIGAIYLRKSTLGSRKAPKTITVTVEG